jgi:hypothetical protein
MLASLHTLAWPLLWLSLSFLITFVEGPGLYQMRFIDVLQRWLVAKR